MKVQGKVIICNALRIGSGNVYNRKQSVLFQLSNNKNRYNMEQGTELRLLPSKIPTIRVEFVYFHHSIRVRAEKHE